MGNEELFDADMTIGEATVLVGQLVGMPAERVGGWTLIAQARDTLDIMVGSSAVSRQTGVNRPEVTRMLLEAVQKLIEESE